MSTFGGSDAEGISEHTSQQAQVFHETEAIAEPVSRLYFVRHGRSTHNDSSEKRPLIWDAELHEIGIRQAALLRQEFIDVPLEIVVTSPLKRAIQTALIALGHWSHLSPGCTVRCASECATVKRVMPMVQVDQSGVRFNASDDDLEPLDGQGLGPGARARLLKDVKCGKADTQRLGTLCTVTNAAVSIADVDEARSCLDVFPATALRCKVVAWPEATEQLHESDDLGSPASDLRCHFPSVDFTRLPQDTSTWWWSDPKLPETLNALTARRCWEQHGRQGMSSRKLLYDEPDCNFEERIGMLIKGLDALAVKHKHLALFAHCWVLEEIWCQRFGKGRRFGNAEVAAVEVLRNGEWRWLRVVGDEDSSDEDSSD